MTKKYGKVNCKRIEINEMQEYDQNNIPFFKS